MDSSSPVLSSPSTFAAPYYQFAQRLDPDLRRRIGRFPVRLSEAWDLLPLALHVDGVQLLSRDPVAGGGFADIFRGTRHDMAVAVKRLRFHTFSEGKRRDVQKRLYREALVWRQQSHRHILPFLGIDNNNNFSLVSPWMQHGSVIQYLETSGRESIEVVPILSQVATGLEWLHEENIVHGDLRGANILIDEMGQARLADFGLSIFADSTRGAFTTSSGAGSTRWMAPELMQPQQFGFDRARRSRPSDVYAFGHVCLEIYTGHPPFFEDNSEPTVITKVLAGERPTRPTEDDCHGHCMSDELWRLMKLCWTHDPAGRPSASKLIYGMVRVEQSGKISSRLVEDNPNREEQDLRNSLTSWKAFISDLEDIGGEDSE
ncbi:hypothetical protein JAAARDRAFT_133559 [Jaapia argillacea MUCL 33604]|uniref:Protein kinase domain-containing protein n=1 Tax=Jaapia argillacea MUCL 33604 TaxID=933084 RepID=A0A067PLI8_9AGAM|nr:hypothetical protein JAAARDRAFT_133559 [Jaapia argillacea MUCL 33604]